MKGHNDADSLYIQDNMNYILFIAGIVFLVVNLLRRPKTRLFLQTRIAPLLNRGVQKIRQEKDKIVSNPKTKRRAILIAIAIGVAVLALIFR